MSFTISYQVPATALATFPANPHEVCGSTPNIDEKTKAWAFPGVQWLEVPLPGDVLLILMRI